MARADPGRRVATGRGRCPAPTGRHFPRTRRSFSHLAFQARPSHPPAGGPPSIKPRNAPMSTSDPVLVRIADATEFYEGPELCREYLRNEALWFGSSLVNPGDLGAVDPGHEGAWEVFYCVSGEGYMDDGTREYFMRAGDVLAFPPTVPHRIHNRGSGPVLMVWAGGAGFCVGVGSRRTRPRVAPWHSSTVPAPVPGRSRLPAIPSWPVGCRARQPMSRSGRSTYGRREGRPGLVPREGSDRPPPARSVAVPPEHLPLGRCGPSRNRTRQ